MPHIPSGEDKLNNGSLLLFPLKGYVNLGAFLLHHVYPFWFTRHSFDQPRQDHIMHETQPRYASAITWEYVTQAVFTSKPIYRIQWNERGMDSRNY